MSRKKEKLLKKYLDKKKKQRKRDIILAQIAEIDKQKRGSQDVSLRNNYLNPIQSYCGDFEERKNLLQERSDDKIATNLCVEKEPEFDTSVDEDLREQNEVKNSTRTELQNYGNCKNDVSLDSRYLHNEENDFTESNKEITSSESLKNVGKDHEKCSLSHLICETSDVYEEEAIETENIDVESFLGEKKAWKNVVCQNRKEEIQRKRMEFPIFYEQSEIISQIRKNDIVIIKGETGSGKTTQLPQFLYEGGFAEYGLIGVTQPRRISTISISHRINEEMNDKICGYTIRYESTVKNHTKIKIMTDGILIKEIQEDFLLNKYSVVVLDEIHERSKNIDILISLLSRIINIRKTQGKILKLVLMSAIDMFKEINSFFDDVASLTIPSQSHKVSIFYEQKTPDDYVAAAFERIKKLLNTEEGTNRRSELRKIPLLGKNNVLNDRFASILVFLPSKSDIYRLKNILESYSNNLAVLPLHSSLSKEDQSLIYRDFESRKIILSTNIAETSITIPDVVFVLDTGRVKKKIISNGILEYVVEFISKSSAIQRSGRAGRTCPGVCYRLYSGPNFLKFKDFEDPQILCEPIEETVLDLLALGITNIYKYPFLNRPSDESIKEALGNLKKLGIIDEGCKITKVGSLVSKLPLSPRVAMLLCIPNTNDISSELIDLVSCMSLEVEICSISGNKMFYEGQKSDFIVLLNIYRRYLKENDKRLFCKNMKINYFTFREIEKISSYIRKKLNVTYYENNEVSSEISEKIRKIIFFAYSDHLSISDGSSYFFRNQKVFPSANSIKTDESFLVFDVLVKGNTKTYMKNITVVDKEWFT